MKYKGWVPNVSGRLSFTQIAQTDKPQKVVEYRYSKKDATAIAAYQHRFLSDTTIPIISNIRWLTVLVDRYLFKKDGNFWFLFLGKTGKKNQNMYGNVYVFDRKGWQRCVSNVAYGGEHLETSNCREDICLKSSVGRYVEAASIASCSYSIQRDGEFSIWMIKVQHRNSDKSEIASQMYFFVRDLFHSHKFHSYKTDSILDIFATKWRQETAFAIMRKATALRRSASIDELHNARGVVGYVQAFLTHSGGKKARSKYKDLAFFQNSLMYKIARLESKHSKTGWEVWESIFNATVAALAGAVAITFLLFNIYDDAKFSLSEAPFLVNVVHKNPFFSIAIFVSTYILIRFSFFQHILFPKSIWGNFQRLAVVFGKKGNFALIVLLVLLGSMGLYLIF